MTLAYLCSHPTYDLALIESLGFRGIRFDIRGSQDIQALDRLPKHPNLTPLCIVAAYDLVIPTAEAIAKLGRGAIELVNEPNLGIGKTAWDPVDWAGFTKAAYPAIKVEELHGVEIPVVSGGVSNLNRAQVDYWRKALKAGLKFDVLGWHRYRTESPPSTPLKDYKSRAAEFAMVQELAGGKPAWCTETGWNDLIKTTEEVAQYAAAEYKIQQAAGVPVMAYYQVVDGPDRSDPEACFGILRFGGTQKPVARAWAAVLGGKA